jgi:BirA family transcriptional regulator, biotin operon repressor / biotin---[acetyl-CoA-carboxylase] ligase
VDDGAGRWSDLGRPPLRATALRRAVEGPGGWRAFELVARTGSTNADLADRARAGEAEGLVLAADHQSAGRGRLGREWVSPARAGIAVSVLLRPGGPTADGLPAVDPGRWSWLPLLAGLALVDALTRTCGLAAELKWPNDVLVPVGPDRGFGAVARGSGDPAELGKVCGVLAEAVDGAVVVGAGINVSQEQDELPVPTATSLLLAGSATTDRDTVLRAYLRALAVRYAGWRQVGGDARAAGATAGYREACGTIGRRVRVDLPGDRQLFGLADGVDDEGRLLLLADGDGRPIPLAAGDVVHLRADRPGTEGG